MPLHRSIAGPAVALGLIVAGAAAGGTAACGGQVAPAAWAKSVCSALTPWRGEIDALTSRAQRQLADPAAADPTTPAKTRQNLVDLLAGARTASETARAKVVAAGTPDVDGGDRIVARFVDSLRAARDAYGHAMDTIEGLDTTDAKAFYAAVGAAFQRLTKEYSQSALNTKNVGSVDLQRAFAEVPECR
jgi:hypothetical protein